MLTHPIDSTEARELREADAERAAEAAYAVRLHAVECDGGWRGEDEHGRPRPCTICRPHLLEVACRTCGVPPTACRHQLEHHRGRCCVDCDHQRQAGI